MNRPAAAWFAGLLVGAATATAAWVRLAGHPASSAATRAQLAAIRLGIRALEAWPTREWDDEDGQELAAFDAVIARQHGEGGTPQRRGQDGPLAPRDPDAGTPGGSRAAQARTGGLSHLGLGGGAQEAAYGAGGFIPGYADAETVAAAIRRDEPRITEAAVRSYAAAWLEGRRREREDP